MSDEHTKSAFYKEGHKRETRKSYKLFLDEIMDDSHKTEESSSNCDEASDDSSIRRSKRTPIPKRNFKLIDDYESKEPAKKKNKKDESTKAKTKVVTQPEVKLEPEENVSDDIDIPEYIEKEDSEEVTPRKSSRAPKPKVFKDSIALPYITKPQITKESTDIFISPTEVVKQRRKSSISSEVKDVVSGSTKRRNSSDIPASTKRKNSSSDIPTSTKKKSSLDGPVSSTKKRSTSDNPVSNKRKSSSDEHVTARGKVSSEDLVSNKRKSSILDKSLKTKKSSEKKSTKATPSPSSVKSKSVKPKSKKGTVKQEIESDTSQLSSASQDSDTSPKKKNRTKTYEYESYVTTGSKKYVNLNDSTAESSEDQTLVTSPSIESTPSSDQVTLSEKSKNKSSKSSAKKVTDKQPKKKNREKLLVSFKKKKSEDADPKSKKKKKKKDAVSEFVSETGSTEVSEVVQDMQMPSVPSGVPSLVDSPVKATESPNVQKKKSKKKTKKKLDHKNQKVIDVKTFPVEDETVTKVKKKKIYKKRNNKKVLVRIIKNHCNEKGEIVKTETVIVDSVPVDDLESIKQEPIDSQELLNEASEIIEQNDSLNVSFEENNDMDYEQNLAIVQPKQEEADDEYEPDVTPSKGSPKKIKKKDIKKKSIAPKKLSKVVKKPSSRPANKNVTVGGKVVGKTTKGMKKTGIASLDHDTATPPITHHPPPKTEEIVPKIMDMSSAHSEPKNAYNLFCRKYRPLIVQQHPKADFAEISRRLAALWNSASASEKQEHRVRFNELQTVTKAKLLKLNRTSPSLWSETDFKYIKKAISEKEHFTIPQYSTKRLQPVDFAAHLQLLGDSLNVIAGALEQQASMTVHGAMSVLLDSILCSLAPLIFLTSQIPEMGAIDDEQQARILDNVAYILPGL